MVGHLVFDFDGTLADSLDTIVQAYNEVAAVYGFRKVTKQDYGKLQAMSMRERLRWMGVPLYRLLGMKSAAADFLSAYARCLPNVKFVPGMRPLLARLKREGCRISVLSSNSAEIIRRFLETHNCNLVDGIYASDGLLGKARPLIRYRRRFGLAKDNLLYIGDEVRDVEACRKAGVRMAAVSWGLDRRSVLQKAGAPFIADNPKMLESMLRKRNFLH